MLDEVAGANQHPKRAGAAASSAARKTLKGGTAQAGYGRGTLRPFVAPMVRCSIEDPSWLELVRADPAALPFHHPAWTLLLAESYAFKPFVLGLVDGSGRIVAGIPVVEVGGRFRGRRWVSLPFTDVCPPLADSGVDSFAAEIEQARWSAGIESVEVRARLRGAAASEQTAVLHELPLTADPEQVAASFRASVRRNIRTAERGPAVLRIASTESDLTETFYGLHVDVRRRLGLPVQPRRFFRLLWSRMIQPGLGRVLLADVGAETVAGADFLTWNRSVVYKYGASDPRYWPLRPNNLLFWDAIKWACENGYERLDFGRTNLNAPSLRRFKLGWATQEHPLEYTLLGSAATNGLRDEPPQIVRSAIRRSPRWVVRALGEILYRGAA
jgi:CelD/BcsL family acetyltransferase involved in cellulose biosynthesis